MKRPTLLIAAVVLMLGFALIRGFVLLDFSGALLFGLFGAGSGFAVVCSSRALSAKKRVSACVCATLAVLMLVPVVIPQTCFADYPFMAAMADIQRRTRSIQQKLDGDPELSSVDVKFMAPSGTKQKWVQVSGSVETKPAFDDLKSHLKGLEFPIRYNLLVGGDRIRTDEP
ncbi:hypothetical protein [Neorhodopirellula lusitana]|uniref:hypothetical protein n=1 Tax=Neorhodopirellula lusitana TaxID=445327 RepID=UPI00384BE7DB